MEDAITFVGLDAHKVSISSAMLLTRGGIEESQIPNEPKAIRRLAKKLLSQAPGKVVCCYEAGPCGYTLQRELRKNGVECVVVAPSLIPVKPGARVKTDRKDARKLAELLKAGLLTEVHPPTQEEEAVRDLCRCREGAVEDLRRHRHQLSKFLLRRSFIFTAGKKAWTKRYMEWLQGLRFELTADQSTFDDTLLTVQHATERLRTLEVKIEELATREPYREPVSWLRCFRGIDTTSAMIILTELHDVRRFLKARQLMAYLGLVPREDSSGEKQQRGSITKTGNAHVRRILVEAAWNYHARPSVSSFVNARRRGQPPWVVHIAEKAEHRLHRKYWKLDLKGKSSCKAAVAVARELVGFLWAALVGHQKEALVGK